MTDDECRGALTCGECVKKTACGWCDGVCTSTRIKHDKICSDWRETSCPGILFEVCVPGLLLVVFQVFPILPVYGNCFPHALCSYLLNRIERS